MGFGGQVPDKIGRYEIVLQIARGGMATVYLARAEGHGGFDRYVALKLTAEHLRDDPEFGQHLVEEAKLVAHLRHTNVVPVLDVGTDEQRAVFLVMEYVPGDSLGGLVRAAKKANLLVPPRIGMRVLIDALAGLHAAHEHADEDGNPHRLVHRDFSPQNILVGTDGIARLTDFGIAKAASRASITVAGTMKGKISYASPEQARGQELDRRCDVWAAGVVAWEVLAGRKLYPSNERTLLDIVKAPPPRVRTVVPDLPGDLDEAIAYALQLEAANRPATAQAFARILGTAARDANLLAELDEVADYVQVAVAPVLEERKQKIAEARRVRAQVKAASAPAAATGTDDAGDTELLPSLPEIPMVTRRLVDAPTVPSSVADHLRGTPASGGSIPANPMAFEANPTAFAPELRPSDASVRRHADVPSATGPGVPTTPAFVRSSLASIQELKQTVVDRAARFIAERPALVIGGASAITTMLLLGAALVVVVSRGPSADAAPTAVASVRVAPPASSSVAGGSPTNGAAADPSPPPSLGEAEPLPAQLQLVANQPIARVRIGKRVVDVEVPAPSVAIDLTPAESRGRLSIVASTKDGRSATGSFGPGDDALTLAFGAAPARKPAATKPRPKKR